MISLPLLALLGVAAAWHALIPGVAYWDNAIGALVASVRFTGPVAAALAAWTASRHRRRSRSSRPVELGLLVLVASTAYAFTALVVIIKTAVQDQTGQVAASGVLAGAAALALHVVVGYLAGRLLPRWIAPTFVGVGGFVLTGWLLTRHGEWWRLLAPTTTPPQSVFVHSRPGIFRDQLAWYTGLAAMLALGHALAVSRRAVLAVPLALAGGLAGFGALRLGDYQGREVAPDSAATEQLACRDWPLTVCVHPALRQALPTLEAAFLPVAARLADTPGGFDRLEQRPDFSTPQAAPRGVRYIHVDDLSAGYARQSARELVDQLLDPRMCAGPAATPDYSELVVGWLADDTVTGEGPAAQWFAHLSEQSRRRWLRAHYTQFRRCRLSAADFRGSVSSHRRAR